MSVVRRCCSHQLLLRTLAAVLPQLRDAVCASAFCTTAAQPSEASNTGTQHVQADHITFTSLNSAARQPETVRRLDLAASPQLLCANLLCDKVGDPCICRISRLFEQLHAVEELVLRGNGLTELPPSTWQLTSLRALDLSNNRLSALPPEIASLQQLEVLKLTGNSPQLQLPHAVLSQLPQLQELYVDRGIREQMMRTPEAAPLLHWLRF